MKKMFLIALIAGSLAACNNSGETTENKNDSLDSIGSEKKNAIDSTAARKEDKIDFSTQLRRKNKRTVQKKG